MVAREENVLNLLGQISSSQAEALLRLNPVVLLPVGAVEAHGPHLPLETDLLIAEEVCLLAAHELKPRGICSVIAPGVRYTVCLAASCFPGTISVQEETLSFMLRDVFTSLAGQGFKKLCIVNCHLAPEHLRAISSAISLVEPQLKAGIAFPDMRQEPWVSHLGEEFQRGARHGGSYETSLILAKWPNLVNKEVAAKLTPVWVNLPEARQQGARDFKEAGSPQGYFGDPSRATCEEGMRLYGVLTEMVVAAVMDIM